MWSLLPPSLVIRQSKTLLRKVSVSHNDVISCCGLPTVAKAECINMYLSPNKGNNQANSLRFITQTLLLLHVVRIFNDTVETHEYLNPVVYTHI